MTKILLLGTFAGGYGRQGIMRIHKGQCELCRRYNQPVFFSDGSEGEYNGAAVCFDCLSAAFAKWLAKYPQPPTLDNP